MPILNPMTGQPIAPRFTVPDIFGGAMSYTDQIQMLIAWVEQQVSGLDYVSEDALAEAVATLQAAIAAGDAADAQALANAVSYLEGLISGTSEGALIWDLSRGRYGANQDVTRSNALLFDPWACTVEQLNALGLTVDRLSTCGLNCAGLAAVGTHLTEPTVAPNVPARYKYDG